MSYDYPVTSAPSPTSAPAATAPEPAGAGRIRRADAAWLTGAGLVGALVLSLELTAVSAAVITIGIPLLLLSAPLRRRFADAQRRRAGRALGQAIPSPYRAPAPPAPDAVRRALTALRDPATWRDLLFLLVDSTVGVLLPLLSLALLATGIFYLIFPFLWAVTPPGVFETNFGIFTVHTQALSYTVMPLGALGVALWWFATPGLLRAHARLARALLR